MNPRPQPGDLDRLLFHWPHVIATASNEWAKGFAKSIGRQARNPRWKPSPKQRELMARMVAQLFDEADDVSLIE